MKKISRILVFLFCFIFYLNLILNGQIISTVAGGGTSGLGDGGPATDASFGWFGYVIIDAPGNIYVDDANNQRIRKVDGITGIINTVAGIGTAGYNGDGIPATLAQLNWPDDVAIDKMNNLYIVDNGNYRIRKVDAITGIISTFAGTGVAGFDGNGGQATAAKIIPNIIACDAFGNLYIAENYRLRKVNSSGIIDIVAGIGTSGAAGDGGPATAAQINIQGGLCTDGIGNIYLQDSTQSVRKIDVATGIITRVAGTGNDIYSPYLGDGIAATASHICPYGIAADHYGNLFITDACNERIEVVKSNGYIYTIAGNGIGGYSGDGGNATNAELKYPEDVALDTCGNVYIADFGNKVVRKVTYSKCHFLGVNDVNEELSLNIYPNPTYNTLNIDNLKTPSTYQLINLIGKTTLHGTLKEGNNTISLQYLPPGMYLLELIGEDGERVVRKVVKE